MPPLPSSENPNDQSVFTWPIVEFNAGGGWERSVRNCLTEESSV